MGLELLINLPHITTFSASGGTDKKRFLIKNAISAKNTLQECSYATDIDIRETLRTPLNELLLRLRLAFRGSTGSCRASERALPTCQGQSHGTKTPSESVTYLLHLMRKLLVRLSSLGHLKERVGLHRLCWILIVQSLDVVR